MQLCFANPEVTNCTYEKFTNDKCDEGCDNKYCSGYEWQTNFQDPLQSDDELYQADLYNCPARNASSNANSTCTASSRNSVYIDPNLEDDEWIPCSNSWVGDGECDDGCRTEECEYDAGDCDLGL